MHEVTKFVIPAIAMLLMSCTEEAADSKAPIDDGEFEQILFDETKTGKEINKLKDRIGKLEKVNKALIDHMLAKASKDTVRTKDNRIQEKQDILKEQALNERIRAIELNKEFEDIGGF